jgi:hypothetical protein
MQFAPIYHRLIFACGHHQKVTASPHDIPVLREQAATRKCDACQERAREEARER